MDGKKRRRLIMMGTFSVPPSVQPLGFSSFRWYLHSRHLRSPRLNPQRTPSISRASCTSSSCSCSSLRSIKFDRLIPSNLDIPHSWKLINLRGSSLNVRGRFQLSESASPYRRRVRFSSAEYSRGGSPFRRGLPTLPDGFQLVVNFAAGDPGTGFL